MGSPAMGWRKRRPENAVDVAVNRIGGPLAAARLCGVTRAAIHQWQQLGRIRQAVPAVKLAKRSGIPVEQLIGLEDSHAA